MVGVEQEVPLYVPIIFLGWGVLVAWLNRKAFKDPDGALRRMAAKRAKSRAVRLVGGSGDPQREYEQLRRNRWIFPVVAVAYASGVLWLFVVALRQL